MTTYITGVLEACMPGSDDHVRWLAVRCARGPLLCAVFDYQGVSAGMKLGNSYELALQLTYPMRRDLANTECWHGIVVDLEWPKPTHGVARAPLPREKHEQQPVRRKKKNAHRPTGPTCVLVQTPFGHLLTSVSQLQHHLPDPPHAGTSFHIPLDQRLDLLAVLG
jgi:hypothetical protein